MTVTVTETGTFSQPVDLSCSGQPLESTCTFITPVILAGGGVTQLAIHPEAPHNCSDSAQYFIAGQDGKIALALGALSTLLFGLRRRRFRSVLFAFVLSSLTALGGCGWGRCTDLGTRPGNYTFTVTGTAAGRAVLSHSQTVHIRVFVSGG